MRHTTPSASVRVWDMVVRLTHWGLAASVLLNLWVIEEGASVHEVVGYVAVGIVVIRLIWGLVGTQHARFTDFFPTPSRLIQHGKALISRTPDPHMGHNPLGALMVFAIWSTVIALGISGYMMEAAAYGGEGWVEEVHEVLANLLIMLIVLHILAVIGMSILTNTNLPIAMITGKKPSHKAGDNEYSETPEQPIQDENR